MAKYVFLNMPAYGHVNPTLAVAQELVKRGQDVIYYLPELFQDAVQATGAVFRRYDSKLKSISPMPITSGIVGGALSTLMVEESRHVLPQVLESIRAEQPDYIVYGAMCLWARIVTQVLNVPAIALRHERALQPVFHDGATAQPECPQHARRPGKGKRGHGRGVRNLSCSAS